MTDQVDPAAVDATTQTEQNLEGSEQQTERTAIGTSFEDALLKAAAEDGHVIGEPPKAEAEPEANPEETEVEETESKPDDATKIEEKPEDEAEVDEKPEEERKSIESQIADAKAKGEKPKWYLSRIAEGTAAKKRANDRADKAESLVQQYQAQLQQTVAPRPTEDNPFVDVQDVNALDRLERSYEKTIDLADENPDGAVDVVIGRDPATGREIKQDFTPEQLMSLRKKADKAIRKFIPERRDYLAQRAVADAQALEVYPELKDPESDFAKAAGFLAQRLLNGQAQKDPTLLVWIGHAVKGYQDSLKRNGKTTMEVKSPAAKQIIESARQKVAPTPTKTRSFVERRTSSANLEKLNKKFEETGTQESAEELVGALLSQKGGSKRLEPIAE